MANRETKFLLKRSNVPGKVPSSGDLNLGELALNTADVILYASGTTSNRILPIGWDRIHRTGDTVTGDFNFYGDLSISGSSLPNGYALSVTGDTNFLGDVYVDGDLFYNGSVIITGSTNIQNGLTANTIYTDYIDFNTGATVTSSPGRIYWDTGTGTLNVTVGDVGTGLIDLQVGQEEIVRVFNAEATTLQKGEIVYVSGSQGNRPAVKRAQAQTDQYSVTTLGMVDLPIASGAEGYVTTFGVISNLNTLGLTGGTPIWLSPTTPGAYTSTKPIAPDHTVLIGYVVRVSATVGSIFVNISNGWEIEELHDVRISGATNGDLLVRSTFNGSPVWVNSKTLDGTYRVNGNLIITGSGTGNTVRITQTGTGNALTVEDDTNPDSTPFVINNLGNVGIGLTTPTEKLNVSGNTKIEGNLNVVGDITVTGNANLNTLTANTIGSSGNCVNDIYVSNIHSCSPLNINPLNEGNVYFGSTSGVTIDVPNSRLGIGVKTPQYPIEIVGSNSKLYYDINSAGGNLVLSGNTNLPRMSVSNAPYLTKPGVGGSFGIRAWDDPSFNGYGKVGDLHIYAGDETNGLNIINNGPGTNTDDYIRFYAGRDATNLPDIHIQGSGSTRGYVGINTTTPTTNLDINGKTKTINLQITSGANNGYILVSDSLGNATWQLPTSFSGGSVTGLTVNGALTVNTTSDTNWFSGNTSTDLVRITQSGSGNALVVEDSTNPDSTPFVVDASGFLGLGTSTPQFPLDVRGNGAIVRFGTNANFIQRRANGSEGSESNLTSGQAIGNNQFQAFQSGTTYQNVGRIAAEADANHSSSSLPTRLTFWTTSTGSTTIVERMRIDNQGRVGIGTTTPGARLDVRSQGTATTDIPFRVRNSGNTLDIIRTFHDTNGTGDVFIGEGAGNVTTGVENSFFGINAGLVNSTGTRNIGTGAYSLLGNTTGGFNAVLGYFAFGRNVTGSTNVAIGSQAGTFITGAANNTASNNSVFIGANTRANGVNQTNQIVIGEGTTGLGSNTVVLGNASITTTALRGQVGIGTTAPSFALQVSTDSAAKPSTNTWTISSDERLKENIEEADYDICYDVVKNLPLKRYTWKNDVYSDQQAPDRSKLGWIAQDVETIFPKAINIAPFYGNGSFNENTNEFDGLYIADCKNLNADQIYAAMYGTIKKLITENEMLKTELESIKNHLGI